MMKMKNDSAIYKSVRRANMYLLIASLVSLIIVAVMVTISSGAYWYAQLTGPIEISAKDIAGLDGSTRLYNRYVEGDRMRDTNYFEEIVNEYGTVIRIDAYFGALEIEDDVWLFVRTDSEINRRVEDYTGTLQPVSGDVTVEVYALAQDEMRIEFLPVMLDTTGDEIGWYVGTAVLVALTLFGIWGLFTYLKRSGNPNNHPTLKKLGRFGDAGVIASDIEADLATGENKVGDLRFSNKYLVHSGGSFFKVMPYDQVAWVYKKITKRNGVASHSLHLFDTTGEEIVISSKEDKVNAMIQAVYARAPWAIAGYSDQISQTWNKDREAFLQQVEMRRQMASQQ